MNSIYIGDLLIIISILFILIGGLYWLHRIDLQKQPKKYFFVIFLVAAFLLCENFLNVHFILPSNDNLRAEDAGDLYDFVEPLPYNFVVKTISVKETASDRYIVGRTFFGLSSVVVTERGNTVSRVTAHSTFQKIISIFNIVSMLLIIPLLMLFYFIHLIKSVFIFFIRTKRPSW